MMAGVHQDFAEPFSTHERGLKKFIFAEVPLFRVFGATNVGSEQQAPSLKY
jgi:hypothetical protein